MPADSNLAGALLEFRNAFERPLQLVFAPHDAHQILHQVLQIVLHLIRAFALPFEGFKRLARHFIHLRIVDGARGMIFRELGGKLARALAEDHQIGQRIPAQPIRAVQSGAAFSGREQALDVRHLRIGIHAHAAHHIVRGRPDLHRVLGDIDVAQLLELVVHAGQLLLDMLGRVGQLLFDPGDIQIDAAVRTAAAFASLHARCSAPRDRASAIPADAARSYRPACSASLLPECRRSGFCSSAGISSNMKRLP